MTRPSEPRSVSGSLRPRALSVSELNHQARHLLETSFMRAWVEGEISGLSRPSSGHWYFSLKDARCQVRCAMFRGFNQRLREVPKEGDLVRVGAKVSLYENRGDFQLIVEHMEPAGLGALQQAFDALKARLQAEGLFAEARKKPIPAVPRHIGVITSPTGAAIHDILTVLARRCPAIPVTLYPTSVQGTSATSEIVSAIERAVRHNIADVLIISRGGGSLEDLWCFNEEAVARAVAACPIATVSAVGHEVDVTITDFVADLRAPTPSAAAESLSPDQSHWHRQFGDFHNRLRLAQSRLFRNQKMRLDQLRTRLRDPRRELQERAQRLDDLERRFLQGIRRQLEQRQASLAQSGQRLQAHQPSRQLAAYQDQLQRTHGQLLRVMDQRLEQERQRLAYRVGTLNAISPLSTLGRGYAIVSSDTQTVVRRSDELQTGDRITARLGYGSINATVTGIHSEQDELLSG